MSIPLYCLLRKIVRFFDTERNRSYRKQAIRNALHQLLVDSLQVHPVAYLLPDQNESNKQAYIIIGNCS